MSKFSKWLLCAFVLTICAGASYAAEPESTNAPQLSPSIQMPETNYSFGEIVEEGEVSHDFVVKNTGDANLDIAQVQPG